MLEAAFVLQDIQRSSEIGAINDKKLAERMRDHLSQLVLGSHETK